MQIYSLVRDIISGCWLVFITVWVLAALSTKRVVYRESRAQRLRYWAWLLVWDEIQGLGLVWASMWLDRYLRLSRVLSRLDYQSPQLPLAYLNPQKEQCHSQF